jgi:hypothetical protein
MHEQIGDRPEARLLARLGAHLLGVAPLLGLGPFLRVPGALDHREAERRFT